MITREYIYLLIRKYRVMNKSIESVVVCGFFDVWLKAVPCNGATVLKGFSADISALMVDNNVMVTVPSGVSMDRIRILRVQLNTLETFHEWPCRLAGGDGNVF